MLAVLDTTVLVACLVESHPQHAICRFHLDAAVPFFGLDGSTLPSQESSFRLVKFTICLHSGCMVTIPIRDLQQRGSKAIAKGTDEPVLVIGRPGALFYLIPADQDRLAEQEVELSRAMARASLRSWQNRAVSAGLDVLTTEEIEAEISAARQERRIRSKAKKTHRPVRPVGPVRA